MELRELVNLDEGQSIYPGSAPLDGGKDLLPAYFFIDSVDIDYKVDLAKSSLDDLGS